MLADYSQTGKALLAVNFYNYETLRALIHAAKSVNTPIILQLSQASIDYLGIKPAVAMAKSMLDETGVQGWLHLDHGNSIEQVKACIDAGFDSVMIDASEKPFKENVRLTKEVVKMAEPFQINVEAELGYVAKPGELQDAAPTPAADAKIFWEETGIDALAIAIGNAHGFYKKAPVLQIQRLKEIKAVTSCSLVLQGSSGIPLDQLQQSILAGISKINLATETKHLFMKKLQELLAATDEIDLRKIFSEAITEVQSMIEKKKLRTINFLK